MYTLCTERNFSLQWCAGLTVFILAALGIFSSTQNAILTLLAFLVLALELMNSALEQLCDSDQKREFSLLKKQVKDSAAASVLMMAMGAAIVFMDFLYEQWPILVAMLQKNPWPFFALSVITVINFTLIFYAPSRIVALLLLIVSLLLITSIIVTHHVHAVFALLSLAFHLVWMLALHKRAREPESTAVFP